MWQTEIRTGIKRAGMRPIAFRLIALTSKRSSQRKRWKQVGMGDINTFFLSPDLKALSCFTR